jgi:protein-disulfide isomerase
VPVPESLFLLRHLLEEESACLNIETKNPDLNLLPIQETDHIRGRSDALLTMVEFGDYECPDCGRAYWDILKIEEIFDDRFRFVFRHYAYAKIHPNAELAGQAAEAAGAQGRFWEMHDLLFRNQSALKMRDLTARAEALDLDLQRFQKELKAEKYLEIVRADFKTGVQNGVFGTPGIFINGIRINGATDFETLRSALDRAAQGG